jgi:hypothetical protein
MTPVPVRHGIAGTVLQFCRMARHAASVKMRRVASEPVQSLLRVGHAALKLGSECSFTARKLRFFAQFRLAWL